MLVDTFYNEKGLVVVGMRSATAPPSPKTVYSSQCIDVKIEEPPCAQQRDTKG